MSSFTTVLAQAGQRSVPLSVIFELTNRCNEDCAHCYVDLGDVDNELTTAEVERILGELKQAGALFLTFTGGEIFTRRDTLDLAQRAREMGFALRLFTNGTLLNDTRMDRIAEIGVVAVEISIYSMDDETHDEITRIPGSLQRTLRAVRGLRERGVPVALKAPIMADNVDEYRTVLEFATTVGAEYRFDPSLIMRNDLDQSPLERRLTKRDLAGLCVDPDLGLAVPDEAGSTPDAGDPICSTGRRLCLISARGLVYPCSQRFPPAGDLRRQSFAEVWETSPLLLKLRNITAQDLPQCSGCSNNSFCGRCSLDALFEDGDFWGPQSFACDYSDARREAHRSQTEEVVGSSASR